MRSIGTRVTAANNLADAKAAYDRGAATSVNIDRAERERAQPAARENRRVPRLHQILTGAIALAVSVGLSACGAETKQKSTTAAGATTPAVAQTDTPSGIPQIVKTVQPSIVTLLGERGVGSGVIYRSDGIILTNHHVVTGLRQIEVALANGGRIPGRVIATDADTDLAVIRIDRTGLPAARFQTALPQVGDLAVALGSPLGFEKTVTAGIISGLHRAIPGSASETRSLVDLIQTDAAISPGNSGGAVVDAKGRVLGISEAYVPPQQGAVAIGFAIPAATATRVADQLLAHGRAQHAYLGLQPAALTQEIARGLHVTGGGVLAYEIARDSPAFRARLRPADVLTAIGREKITTVEELFAALRRHKPGETVSIAYMRDGEPGKAHARLSDRP
jgi:serine protease DegQ